MILSGPDREYLLKLNLHLVKILEEDAGLYAIAENLLQKKLKMTEILRLLCVIYRQAGCVLSAEEISGWLLQESPENPAEVLAGVLAEILSPLERMGALGESPAAKAALST